MNRPLCVAINGYGRIGRCVLRALYESPLRDRLRVVAINEPADLATVVYLTRFDSTHGMFAGKVEAGADCLVIDGDGIPVSHETVPEAVDWNGRGVDILLECSGRYTQRRELERFVDSGCPRVLLSQPGHSAHDVDLTVVFGINHHELGTGQHIVSNASCTTNAVVPVLDHLHRAFGLGRVFLTTLHSVMNDQPLIDGYHHSDLRRTRSAMQSIIPVETGLAQGVERLLPQLAGRVQAKAMRVPVVNVSAIDIVVELGRDATAAEINAHLARAAADFPGLIAYSVDPHASVDFNHNAHSVIVDGSQTRLNGPRLANLLIWFDNEWGYANRMVDVASYWGERLA